MQGTFKPVKNGRPGEWACTGVDFGGRLIRVAFNAPVERVHHYESIMKEQVKPAMHEVAMFRTDVDLHGQQATEEHRCEFILFKMAGHRGWSSQAHTTFYPANILVVRVLERHADGSITGDSVMHVPLRPYTVNPDGTWAADEKGGRR